VVGARKGEEQGVGAATQAHRAGFLLYWFITLEILAQRPRMSVLHTGASYGHSTAGARKGEEQGIGTATQTHRDEISTVLVYYP
jgi:hypothetical protein